MRICILADAGSVNTRSWVNGFAEILGHEVHVISINRTGEFGPGVTFHHLGTDLGTHDVMGKLAYLSSIGAVRGLVREIEPDLLVGYRVASYGYVGARTGFRPLVVIAQGEYIVSPRYSIPTRISALTAIREATLLHAWAPHLADRLVELGADPEKILTCPRGVDLRTFTPVGDAERVPGSIICTRHLSRWYKVDVIVKALAVARAGGSALTGMLVGSGPAESDLRELAEALKIGDVVNLPGRVQHDELPGMLERCSIYASAVPTDGVSASLLEAMAMGCFPVVRDNAANRYWVEDGVNGFLVEGDDPEAYATALAEANRNADLRAAAARRNREIVEERGSLERNMRVIERAYLSLLAGGNDAIGA